ncbi:MAG TPA: hypothetical protein VNL16_04735, partial [Chloroflexota bacterium]|nr:hypothetical protein [Chloroflexota bacterium]
IDFEAEFKIDTRGKLGNREVRPHFRTVRVAAFVGTDADESALPAVVEEQSDGALSSTSSPTPG